MADVVVVTEMIRERPQSEIFGTPFFRRMFWCRERGRLGLPESDDTVQIRLDGIAEQKDGSSVHLNADSVIWWAFSGNL
jgi:hypothetical protein